MTESYTNNNFCCCIWIIEKLFWYFYFAFHKSVFIWHYRQWRCKTVFISKQAFKMFVRWFIGRRDYNLIQSNSTYFTLEDPRWAVSAVSDLEQCSPDRESIIAMLWLVNIAFVYKYNSKKLVPTFAFCVWTIDLHQASFEFLIIFLCLIKNIYHSLLNLIEIVKRACESCR